jgi:putative nucleotidyltransferase with HDIG domain
MTLTAVRASNALVLLGDRVEPRPHLVHLFDVIRSENEPLPADKQIQYLVCHDYANLALALRKLRDRIRLVVIGPGLSGKQDMVIRLLGGSIRTILILDPKRPLAESDEDTRRLLRNLRDLGCVVVPVGDATADFYRPLVKEHIVAGITVDLDLGSMTPEQRAEHLDRRLDSVTMFPSLPETQHRVSALKDTDAPKKWAQAIDPDPPMRTVILSLLNSAHYCFRARVTTIEQAVALVSARTIRDIVLACTIQRLFKKVDAARIDQFWRHAVATGYFAKLFAIVADPAAATPQDKTELDRFGLDEAQIDWLRKGRVWAGLEPRPADDAFTAGLLHDIGKVTMALCFEDALLMMDPLVENGVKEHDAQGKLWAESTIALEHSLMGDMDHEAIGGRIARKWGLDQSLQEVITRHHDVRRTSGSLAKLVALADVAANSIHSYPYYEAQHPFARLLARVREGAAQQPDRPEEEVLEEVFPAAVDSDLADVLARMRVPETLWRLVEAPLFFRMCHRLGPPVRRLTASFLKMTAAKA